MSVTVNPKARQILPVILGCCVIGTVFFLAITICSAIKYHDYVPVDAVISSVSRSNNPNKPHSSNYHNYVKYSYTYKEQNYTADRIEFLRLGKAPGKHVQIKCDPQSKPDPEYLFYDHLYCLPGNPDHNRFPAHSYDKVLILYSYTLII